MFSLASHLYSNTTLSVTQDSCARVLLFRGANKEIKNYNSQTAFQVCEMSIICCMLVCTLQYSLVRDELINIYCNLMITIVVEYIFHVQIKLYKTIITNLLYLLDYR